MVYYNDNDPRVCAWLRELIKAGQIPHGDVDERSILDVNPTELSGYRQCHFFAGIGGWTYALRLAEWPEDEEVWTGSCPCQPFSCAGKTEGLCDERHLWPAFRRLISERTPSTVFGEQVASKDGRLWLAGVRTDLETLGYAVGGADLCAAGVGAPHSRQRLFWVADSNERGWTKRSAKKESLTREIQSGFSGENLGGLGDPKGTRLKRQRSLEGSAQRNKCGRLARLSSGAWDCWEAVPMRDGKARRIESGSQPLAHGLPNRVGLLRGYGNAILPQLAAEFIEAVMECL